MCDRSRNVDLSAFRVRRCRRTVCLTCAWQDGVYEETVGAIAAEPVALTNMANELATPLAAAAHPGRSCPVMVVLDVDDEFGEFSGARSKRSGARRGTTLTLARSRVLLCCVCARRCADQSRPELRVRAGLAYAAAEGDEADARQ